MSEKSTATAQDKLRCHSCGFEAPAGSDEWESASDPTLGTLTSCPECASTDVHARR